MKVIEKKKYWFILSGCIILLGILSLIFRGFNYDIDFVGGTYLEVNLHQDLKDYSDVTAIVKDVTEDNNPQVQAVTGSGGQNMVSIKVKEISTETIDQLYGKLADKYGLDKDGKTDLVEQSSISSVVSGEMKRAAILSTVIAGILMLIYITIRFHDVAFGLGALIPLIHDVLVMISFYTILQIPVNNSFIVALLTIVGYSINNTIVVFDRVRENRKFYKKDDLETLCDDSIMQTLGRSLASSFTTIITVVFLVILGVESLRWFALALLIGLLAGTYSSIFIASPMWVILERALHKTKAKSASPQSKRK